MSALTGKRILITRTRKQASELAAQLEALGAVPISVPVIEIVPPESYAELDRTLTQLASFDWLVFTSANAVDVFAQRRIEGLGPKRVAAIGPATAKAVEEAGLTVDLIPPRFVAESLAEALVPQVHGRRVLLVRAEEARDVLPDALKQAGADVTIAPAYRNQVPGEAADALRATFEERSGAPDAIAFTSASTARNLAALLDKASIELPGSTVLASIGPITSAALRECGYDPAIEAIDVTIAALVEALKEHFKKIG